MHLAREGELANATTERLFFTYDKAKRDFRRWTGRPVRKARRFIKRKGKGKGIPYMRGKGRKALGSYLQQVSQGYELENVFKGMSKGKGGRKGKKSKKKTGLCTLLCNGTFARSKLDIMIIKFLTVLQLAHNCFNDTVTFL